MSGLSAGFLEEGAFEMRLRGWEGDKELLGEGHTGVKTDQCIQNRSRRICSGKSEYGRLSDISEPCLNIRIAWNFSSNVDNTGPHPSMFCRRA